MLPNHKWTNFKTVTLDIHFLMVVSSRWDFLGSTMVIKAPCGKKETCFPFFRRFWAIERRKFNDCSKNLVRNDNFITRILQYFVFMFVFWCHYIWKSNLLTQPKNRIYRYLLATFTLHRGKQMKTRDTPHLVISKNFIHNFILRFSSNEHQLSCSLIECNWPQSLTMLCF